MSRRGGYQPATAALGVLAAIAAAAAAVTIGVADTGGTAQPASASVLDASVLDASVAGSAAAVTRQVSETAQRQTLAHWTRQRMRGATSAAVPRRLIRAAPPTLPGVPGVPALAALAALAAVPALAAETRTPALAALAAVPAESRTAARPGPSRAGLEITAPKGTPTASPFSGSPTTGVLFYTTGDKGHFCTASVVDSTVDDLALTAAHCVYSKGFATNIEYVPGYHAGKQPYGAWPVSAITVTNGWKLSHDPDLDFAFLTLAAAGGKQIQARTGGLTIGFTRWYSQKIEAIGHNNRGAEPIRCATKSFRFRTGQMEFYCHGFWTGTSGGPWIIGYNARNGTGTVFGVIGGYELGGDYEWASYSAYLGSAARLLYRQAERASTPHPTPSPPPVTPSPTGSVSIAYRAPRLPG